MPVKIERLAAESEMSDVVMLKDGSLLAGAPIVLRIINGVSYRHGDDCTTESQLDTGSQHLVFGSSFSK